MKHKQTLTGFVNHIPLPFLSLLSILCLELQQTLNEAMSEPVTAPYLQAGYTGEQGRHIHLKLLLFLVFNYL